MVIKEAQEKLPKIKKNIEKSYINFKGNNKRFNQFFKFVFKSNLSDDDESALQGLGKPIIESNILNAYISRLCGEYSKQEPSINVRPAAGAPIDPATLEVVEGHLRHIFFEAKKTNTQYNVYKDQLAGGFSAVKVITEYAHEKSNDQVIKVLRCFEPTMTGFDVMAREMDKSDANYSFELYPMTTDEFESMYPDVNIEGLQFGNVGEGFSWAYSADKEDVIILADYYEKKKKRKKLVRTANGQDMFQEEYDELIEKWNASGIIAQPPAIIDSRWTTITSICRYKVIKNQVIEYEETFYKDLPHVFSDGDSAYLTKTEGAESGLEQFTKPYVYHGYGTQRLKNLALQCLGNDLETMVMHKFMIAKESIPVEPEFQEALKRPQIAQTLVYNAFVDDDPNKPVPPPREINRIPSPPEVSNTLMMTDQMMQGILGSYDAALGVNDNQLSGVAIVEAATQSNAAAMPYLVGNLQTWTRCANIIVGLIPKIYKTPMTIPVINKEGKRDFVKINQAGGVSLNYDDNALQVEVEADVNFQIAKNRALMQIVALMQASPLFAQFMNEEGLEVLLDNVEFRGADILKDKAVKWAQMQQQKAANQPPPPEVMLAQAKIQEVQQNGQFKSAELQQKAQSTQINSVLEAKKVEVDQQKVNNDRIELMINAGRSQAEITTELTKAQAEEDRTKSELMIKAYDVKRHHDHNAEKLSHDKQSIKNKE